MLPYEKKLSKVDTLKLAISYISFLNELVTTGRNPAENAAIKRNQAKLRKTVVQYHRDKNGLPLYKYTLSWNFEDNQFQNGNLVFTRTWTPENPNLKENTKEMQKEQTKLPNSIADTNSSSGFNSFGNSGELTPQSNFIDSTTASLTTSPSSNGSPINYYSTLTNSLDHRFAANHEPMDNRVLPINSETEFNHSATNCSSLTNSISNPSVDSTGSSNSPNSSSVIAASSILPTANSTAAYPLPDHQPDRRTQQIFTTPSLAPSFAYPSQPSHILNQNESNQASSNYSNYGHSTHPGQSDDRLSARSGFSNQIAPMSQVSSPPDQVTGSNAPSNQLENRNYLTNRGFLNGYQPDNRANPDQQQMNL